MHKTDLGGVLIGLQNDEELKKGYKKIMDSIKKRNRLKDVDGIQVQKMLTGGKETILGVTNDPQFGPLIITLKQNT